METKPTRKGKGPTSTSRLDCVSTSSQCKLASHLAAISPASLQCQERTSMPTQQHWAGQKTPKYKPAPTTACSPAFGCWQHAIWTAKGAQNQRAGPPVAAASLERCRLPLAAWKHRARQASAFFGHNIAAARLRVAHEATGRAGKWTRALGGGWSFCCAPVISNSSGPDNQETFSWTSTEPQTC